MTVTRSDIEDGLRNIGLQNGDTVVLHSSLSSLGVVEGGADAVVDAVLRTIGPEGTLVVPAFNYSPNPFDPLVTPSVCGRITEAVRMRPNAVRSLHPTHSVAAIGRDAEEITQNHESVHPFGIGSPLYKVFDREGKILQIGVGHDTDSIIHVAEELAEVPYVNRVRGVRIAGPKGESLRITVRRPGCSRGFPKIEEKLEESGAVSETVIGEAVVRLISAVEIVKAAVEMLSEDPAALLCDIPECPTCAEARAMIAATQIEEEDEAWIKNFKEIERLEQLGE
ncbi:MAG: AAC(3) family N-acetyltransferase [Armatimonadota bacterium]